MVKGNRNPNNRPSKSTSSTLASSIKGFAAFVLLSGILSEYDVTLWPTFDKRDKKWRLLSIKNDFVPSFAKPVLKELRERKKLFEETPPEEVKYWFEYTGPLQQYHYTYSKSKNSTSFMEGRDDSGVVSARFVPEVGGGSDYESFFSPDATYKRWEADFHNRLLYNCRSMGSQKRPSEKDASSWNDWFGDGAGGSTMDPCRILFAMNMVGAGLGAKSMWERSPDEQGSGAWHGEHHSAKDHLERNLKEIDSMCAMGQIAARVQILVCEPIPAKWTEWMDSQLVSCGGKPVEKVEGEEQTEEREEEEEEEVIVEERPSPLQVVVLGDPKDPDTCHALKSGYLDAMMKDLVLAVPQLQVQNDESLRNFDPAYKTTNPALMSSADHDVYVGFKWSSLVTIRSVAAFVQASADLAAAAASPNNDPPSEVTVTTLSKDVESPFLVPSFVRMSYLSHRSNHVAKWRMHGDFFHPAAWEMNENSYEMTWIPDSLSSTHGVNGFCYNQDFPTRSKSEDDISASEARHLGLADDDECGQWWVIMEEEQVSTAPESSANHNSPPFVDGGSNGIWMLTEQHRQRIVKTHICKHRKSEARRVGLPEPEESCSRNPQAVMPLGDLESFLVNYLPNTGLGRAHSTKFKPGYSKTEEVHEEKKELTKMKNLEQQQDIVTALFDYTVYPAALFRKDATIKAVRARDAALNGNDEYDLMSDVSVVKSAYYDVPLTKPREPIVSWCQSLARRGLCSLYADYLRESKEDRCWESCGMRKNWSKIE